MAEVWPMQGADWAHLGRGKWEVEKAVTSGVASRQGL